MDLLNEFYSVLNSLEMTNVEQPLFYNSKVGLRFDIGDSSDIDTYSTNDTINQKYIDYCYERTNKILNCLGCSPDILAIKVHFDNSKSLDKDINTITKSAELPFPDVVDKKEIEEHREKTNIAILLWDLSKTSISKEKLLKEILKSDIGGECLFSSSVFWIYSENNIIFHLYSDLGADLVATEKSKLFGIYKDLNDMILDYDREKIDEIFGE